MSSDQKAYQLQAVQKFLAAEDKVIDLLDTTLAEMQATSADAKKIASIHEFLSSKSGE